MSTSLTFRHELKYYVNYHQYILIAQRLRRCMKLDPHANASGEYHIRSIYLDDVTNKALQEKQAGVSDREKFRIRMYNQCDEVIHVEKKIKRNIYVAKVKEAIPRATLNKLLQFDYSVLDGTNSRLLKEVRYEMKNRLLRPKVIVDYIREAYTARTGNVRITFDKDLRTGLHKTNPYDEGLCTVKALDEPLYIMEVKYDEYIPSYICDIVQMNGLQRQSASKYTICRKYNKTNSWEDQ